MKVSSEQVKLLLKLQQVDRDRLHAKKNLEALPYKKQLMDLQKKLETLKYKHQQIDALLIQNKKNVASATAKKLARLNTEKKIQEDINTTSDFRTIEKKSEELSRVNKQREELESTLSTLEEEGRKINELKKQLVELTEQNKQKYISIRNALETEGGALNSEIENFNKNHSDFFNQLEVGLQEEYKRAAALSGDIVIASLVEDRCDTCRSPLDSAHLLNIRKHAPVAMCPHCKRILVVTE